MSAASITFRCYQCQKLLGASRSRIGSVVNCPKCGAELLVPEPEVEAQDESASTVTTNPAFTPTSGEPGFPAGLIRTEPPTSPEQTPAAFFSEIRTEPISLRPESASPRLAQPSPSPATSESPFLFLQTGADSEPPAQPFPFLDTGATAESTSPPPPAAGRPKQKRPKAKPTPPDPPTGISPVSSPPSSDVSSSELFFSGQGSFAAPSMTDESVAATMDYSRPLSPTRMSPPEVAPSVITWPTQAPSSLSVVPAIATEAEPLREMASRPRLAERDELPRRNDVAIPRTAVVLWSFFVLLALIAAFVAGVFLGHFLWK